MSRTAGLLCARGARFVLAGRGDDLVNGIESEFDHVKRVEHPGGGGQLGLERGGVAAPMTTTARATVQHEDQRVRVTRWDFEPGDSTGHHIHEHDYVVVLLTDGRSNVLTPDGAVTQSQLRAGESYARSAGGEHEVVNAGGSWLAFVEIEIKGPAV